MALSVKTSNIDKIITKIQGLRSVSKSPATILQAKKNWQRPYDFLEQLELESP